MWVSPFGDLRVNGYVLLTAAYRSLSRPSSAPSARASTLRSFCLTALTLLLACRRQAFFGSLSYYMFASFDALRCLPIQRFIFQ